jgi:hypothetical protein
VFSRSSETASEGSSVALCGCGFFGALFGAIMVYWEGRNAVGAKNVGVRTFPEERSTKYGTKLKKRLEAKWHRRNLTSTEPCEAHP